MEAAALAALHSLEIPGPDGRLEALLRTPPSPRGAAVVAHPHPQHGGTMHTKVVHRAAKLLSDRFSLAALRFNFRGVGASAGRYDDGRGETEDLVAAGRFVRARVPGGPFVVAGFSFGSFCALRASGRLAPDVLFLMGVPTDRWTPGLAGENARRVVWIQGEKDEFSRPEAAQAIAATRGWNVLVVPGADHFFAGKLDAFERMAGDAIERALDAGK